MTVLATVGTTDLSLDSSRHIGTMVTYHLGMYSLLVIFLYVYKHIHIPVYAYVCVHLENWGYTISYGFVIFFSPDILKMYS